MTTICLQLIGSNIRREPSDSRPVASLRTIQAPCHRGRTFYGQLILQVALGNGKYPHNPAVAGDVLAVGTDSHSGRGYTPLRGFHIPASNACELRRPQRDAREDAVLRTRFPGSARSVAGDAGGQLAGALPNSPESYFAQNSAAGHSVSFLPSMLIVLRLLIWRTISIPVVMLAGVSTRYVRFNP